MELYDPTTPVAQDTQLSNGHGRIEIRTACVSGDIAWLQERHDWPGLQAVGKITATRRVGDATSEQERYYLLSAAHPTDRFNRLVRGHLGD